MSKLRFVIVLSGMAGLAAAAFAQSPGQPQGPGRPVAPVQTAPTAAFRATNYEIRASLDATGQVMNAKARIELLATDSAREVDNAFDRINP